MKVQLRAVALVLFALAILGVGLAAQLEDQPHPIFAGLKVGDRVDVRFNGVLGDRIGRAKPPEPEVAPGGFEIYNYNGIDTIVALGPDYFVFKRANKQYAVHISQIRVVMIR